MPQTKAAPRSVELFRRNGIQNLSARPLRWPARIPLGGGGGPCRWGRISCLLGRYLRIAAEKVKALIPVGAAAAIAAAFNTPLAAVVFALEELSAICTRRCGSVVLASATSWGMLRLLWERCRFFRCRSINCCIRRNWRFTRCWECWADLFRRHSAGCCCR